jgi:hypothetical protein
MEEEFYTYIICYRTHSGAEHLGVVSSTGLTESENLLEQEVKKQSEEFVFKSIESTKYKSPREGVLFNTLTLH